MENNSELEIFLTQSMSVDPLEVDVPALSAISREKVNSRKKQDKVAKDYCYIFAAYLNLHVKLQNAVIVAIFIGASMLYFTKESGFENNYSASMDYSSNAYSVPVSGSGVLLSITTFAIRN